MPRRDQDAGYWAQALMGIEEGAAEIAPLGVHTEIIEFDRYRAEGFQEAAASLLAEQPDGIILSPIMPEKMKTLIATIHDRAIPCVFFDADLPGIEPLCAIGQDSFRGGYLAGRLLHLLAGKIRKPVAILDAHGEDYHITRRRDGFLRYAGEQKISAIVQEYSGYKGTEITVDEIALFIEANPGLAGIFITNCMAHRVAEAARMQKRKPAFLLVGYDLIPKNQELLRTGEIGAIISQRPKDQGREALLNLYRHVVLEQRILPKIDIPLEVYIKENIPVAVSNS
jgi:LacI family transcriptional regulator